VKRKPTAPPPKPQALQVPLPEKDPGSLKHIGGSSIDAFNNIVAKQALKSLWVAHSDSAGLQTQYQAVLTAMIGVQPKDEIEGMLAAQLIGLHNAGMECFRRAMLEQQTFEGRRDCLNQAAKLTRAYAELLGALDKHRGKGQQRVTVEHVHIHPGGQAIVGVVTPGGGAQSKSEGLPQSPMNQAKRCHARSKRSGKPCQAPAVKGWAVCRMHGAGGGALKGNRNALKHGKYSAQAIAARRARAAAKPSA